MELNGDIYRLQEQRIKDLRAEIVSLQAELARRPGGNYRYDHCFSKEAGVPTLYVPDTARWFVKETK